MVDRRKQVARSPETGSIWNWVVEIKKMDDDSEIVKKEADVYSKDHLKPTNAGSMYNHFRSLEREVERRPLPNYLETVQTNVSAENRQGLVDCFVRITEMFEYNTDTLYLAVSYADRYLSAHVVDKNKLMALGAACMLTAAKNVEVSTLEVDELCYILDNAYLKEEVLDMERDLLKTLNSHMSGPTTYTFLRCFTSAAEVNCREPVNAASVFLSSYLGELSLLDYGCVRFLPSIIAASATLLTRVTLRPNMHPWRRELESFSGYKPCELKECVLALHYLQLNKNDTWPTVTNTYSTVEFRNVATLAPPSEIPVCYFESVHGEVSTSGVQSSGIRDSSSSPSGCKIEGI